MNAWEALVLGLVQGLTEFLPISSSAHLRVVGELIGDVDPGAAFTAITQIGTEAAVLLYFRKDIARIVNAWWRALVGRNGTSAAARFGAGDPDARMAWWIALGSVPIVVGGLLLEDAIDTSLRNLWITVGTLTVFGILLGVIDRVRPQERELTQLTAGHAVAFGFAQALALVPGVSRSGGTITMGRLLGYTREAAARYSFLLAIPAVLGSGLYKLVGSLDEFGQPGTPGVGATLLATVVAFVVGYVVIVWFLKLVSTRSYLPFVVYRILFAGVVVALLLGGALTAAGTGV
ncbi:undecaprenyl-diphosphate phosphatase [Flavimobilis sp. GY10621]|uniref:Undecaprenyl-diphosphatase n=1 Tax=Flavimobilis rhizosphaerae TaxID=2775421 RepID=A0ABR9DTU0_9MICO|nr:undecaprenyl-diphosphate phosphatase [Flavimobilis rhizosphaerae]MBD9699836.1 undecaprenyl-diphosphate phosphatase [Flavimobilis rhizosphaerae]